MFCALSYLEHSKSLAPSPLLNAYLFLSLVFDAVILRTLLLTPFNIAIRNLFIASFIMKGVILLLEAKEKRKYFSSSDRQRSPEEISGSYSQGFFWRLNSIIIYGFRHILKPDELFEVRVCVCCVCGCVVSCVVSFFPPETMSAEVLDTKFWKAWNKCKFD